MLNSSYKQYIWALIIFLGLSLVINYFAIPNMLAHDKLNNELFMIKSANPELFANDIFLEGNTWHFFYVPFVELLRFANKFTGSSEETYRIMVPISFFFFFFGMFVFLKHLGVNFFISIFTAVLSSVYIENVLHENWGIPGPSLFVHRHLALAFLPYVFFLFYKYFRQKHLPFAFLTLGIIGNIHPVSAFYITLAFLGTILWLGGINRENLKKIILCGLFSVLGILPFLIWHFFLYPPDSGGGIKFLADDLYLKAFWTSQSHMSPQGMLLLYKRLFITYWYTFWPLFIVFILALWQRKKEGDESMKFMDKLSIAFFGITAIITFSISAVQQLLQIFFKIPPFLMEEPRAFKFVYFILYLYLGIFLTYVFNKIDWQTLKSNKKKQAAVLAIIIILVTAVGIIGYQKISKAIFLISLKKSDQETGNTCRLPIYKWIKENTPEQSLFMIDPNGFPPFRICTHQGVVYHYRDGAAIAPSSNQLVEWYQRKLAVEKAYAEKNENTMIEAAKKYGADFIVSRECVPIPKFEMIYEMDGENCVYEIENPSQK